MKTLYFLFTLFLSCHSLSAQTILWDRTYGGTKADEASSIVATPDGGYLIGGSSSSDAVYEKSQSPRSSLGTDCWIIKVDSLGNKVWDEVFGGTGDRSDLSVILPLTNGGYLLGASSRADMGYEKSEDSREGTMDYWIIRLDANGIQLWDKTIGGPLKEELSDAIETNDGGFLLVGYSLGPDPGIGYEKTAESRSPEKDYWVVKVDANGNKLWDKVYGGINSDHCYDIVKTNDGNYLLVGSSNSEASFEKSEEPKGGYSLYNEDGWIIKIDSNGNQLWDKTIGGSMGDRLKKAIPTSDGGFLLGGESKSSSGFDKSQNSRGSQDYWAVKVDSNGNQEWDKTYGGTEYEIFKDLLKTSDDQVILVGGSASPQGYEKSETNKGLSDYWILKTTLTGKIVWDITTGGSSSDRAVSALLDSQAELLVLGYSYSPLSHDKTDFNRGINDYWLVKLDTTKRIPLLRFNEFIICFPCWPWEIWWDFEYRYWNERYGVEEALYRHAFSGEHQDEVFWLDEESLALQLHQEELSPGSYQLQIRVQRQDGSSTEWTEPVAFEVSGREFEVFPNPVGEVLNIHFHSAGEEIRMQLWNRFGRLILSEERVARRGLNEWQVEMPWIRLAENPLTLKITSPSQGQQSWQLLRE